MSVKPPLKQLAAAARRRAVAIALALGLPPLAAATVLEQRALPLYAAHVLVVALVLALGVVVRRLWHRRDDAWAVRRLDDRERRFEDSADLLLRDDASLTPLVRLQRERVQQRLEAATVDLREPWPRRALAASWLLSLAVAAGALLWPVPQVVSTRGGEPARTGTAASHSELRALSLRIEAPAYTGLPPRELAQADAKVEEGANLTWSLRFDTQPEAVALRFHDGLRLALARDGGAWRGRRVLKSAALYRIELEGAPPLADPGPHRLELLADRAPEVRVLEPDRTLTLLTGKQSQWTLAFEAGDDYGIAAARLELTLAQGTGENVTFKSRTIELEGDGDARHKRYRHVLDLKALGIAPGDDVIARLGVTDTRVPESNTTRSASFILRWPPEAGSEGSGVEGVVERALPAYFRSQRQIIIDTEALRGERAKLRPEAYATRANGIAEDQKILRLRYGQFLGEESEEPEAPGETGHQHGEGGATPDARIGAKAESAFGELGATESEYGHVHDIPEAATLLDAETRETLRRALTAMWQAERQLRQAALDQALPAENQALVFIKQVQQSARIYLARLGLELPAIDETRRLSGDRRGVSAPGDALVARSADPEPAALWQALAAHRAPDFAAVRRWAAAHERELPDALGLLAALERLEAAPDCAPCRAELERVTWPLLRAPAAGAPVRAARGESGHAYLDTLAKPEP